MTADIATVASDYYLQRWAILRDEAERINEEARKEQGPVAAATLRKQAKLADHYANLCHHASWSELHDMKPE